MEYKITQKEFELLEKKFERYKNNIINKNSIRTYIQQFEILEADIYKQKALEKAIINILKKTIFITEEDIVFELEKLIFLIYSYCVEKPIVIKYGKKEDSSRVLLDFLKNGSYKIKRLERALETDDTIPLIFIDDGANSGHQIVSVFQEYMGINRKNRATNEIHVQELNEIQKEALKKRTILIGFIYFNENAKQYILYELKKLGFVKVRITYNHCFNKKINERDDIFESLEQKQIVMKCFKQAGMELLLYNKMIDGVEYKSKWSERRIKESVLGYNDAQQLIIFDYNIPTYTLTALWENGYVKDKPWKALFVRRD